MSAFEPSSREVTYLDTKHVSSDVVTPLPVPNVTSSSSKLRLELQASPRDNSVLISQLQVSEEF
jgi:hypothetical protein